MDKRDIRKRMKDLRSMLLESEKHDFADSVFALLENTPAFMLAEHVLMYHSLPDELPTRKFLAKWHDRKKFYLPRVNGVNLDILPYNESRIELGAFQIEEPTGNDCIPADQIEMIVVPGVAFDRKGNRVGRGKGFYDRLLQDYDGVKVGVGYPFQLFEEVPADSHDVRMDMVITSDGCITLTPERKLTSRRGGNNKR